MENIPALHVGTVYFILSDSQTNYLPALFMRNEGIQHRPALGGSRQDGGESPWRQSPGWRREPLAAVAGMAARALGGSRRDGGESPRRQSPGWRREPSAAVAGMAARALGGSRRDGGESPRRQSPGWRREPFLYAWIKRISC